MIRPIVAKAMEAMPAPAIAPQTARLAGAGNAPALPAPAESGASERSIPDRLEEMIDVNRVEGRVKASSLRRVGEIIEKHPEESLAIVRNWLHAEQ